MNSYSVSVIRHFIQTKEKKLYKKPKEYNLSFCENDDIILKEIFFEKRTKQ